MSQSTSNLTTSNGDYKQTNELTNQLNTNGGSQLGTTTMPHDVNSYGDGEDQDDMNQVNYRSVATNTSKEVSLSSPISSNDNHEYSCGLCSLRPTWLQRFANKQTFLAIFCLTSVLQGMYYTYFVSVLTTIEKLYQIQSKTTGMIMSATEIGQIGGALLLTYYGGYGHRPKWIACGMLIFAFASLLCSTPHYLFGNEVGSQLKSSSVSSKNDSLQKYQDNLCPSQSLRSFQTLNSLHPFEASQSLSRNSSTSKNTYDKSLIDSKCDRPDLIDTKLRIKQTVLSIFFVSLLLIGIGATAVNTLGIPYIDDNVAPKESPLYFGNLHFYLLRNFWLIINYNFQV